MKIEPYISAPLQCFKCQKYGHHKECYRVHETCGKCELRDPDHTEEECPNEYRCANCQEDHPTFSRSCGVNRREKEIMKVKYKRNISFTDARKVVDRYIKVTSYTAITQKEKLDRYNTLIEKLLKLEPSNWPML